MPSPSLPSPDGPPPPTGLMGPTPEQASPPGFVEGPDVDLAPPAAPFEPEAPPPLPPPPSPQPLPPPVRSTHVPEGLWLAVIVAGVLALLTAITVSAQGLGAQSTSYRVGAVVGAMAVWPIVMVALFSIGRRFRTPRARAIVVLVVWCLTLASQSGNLMRARAARTSPTGRDATADFAAYTASHAKTEDDATPAVDAEAEPPAGGNQAFDLSPGSHERLYPLVEKAERHRYRQIVSAYRAACAAKPDDALLAEEWVRFVQRFADGDDITMPSAPADLATARAHLESRHANAPGTILIDLETTYGPEFSTKVANALRRVSSWPKSDAAKFHLLRARRESLESKPEFVRKHAEASFKAHPTAEAGLLLAQALVAQKQKEQATAILRHKVFATAPDWIKQQRLNELLDLGATAEALAAFEDLKRTTPVLVRSAPMATKLARAGRIAEGRALLAELGNRWNATWLARQQFEFELEFGDKTHAEAAYDKLRDTGFQTDPLGRERLRLLQRHPSARWSARDLLTLGVFLLALIAAAALPALVLGPVHYWSLLRERRGRVTAWTVSPWGLRTAWWLLATACMGQAIVLWYFYPQLFRTAADNFVQAGEVGTKPLPGVACMWVLLGVFTLALLWRARVWRLMGPGTWSWGKAIGVGIGVAFALRVAVAAYIFAVPGAGPALAQLSPVTTELNKSLLAAVGPLGLLFTIAVFVPVLEEVICRGVMLGAFAKHIPFQAANAMQALAFALLHESLLLAPFFFCFAYAAGLMVRHSGGLLAAIVMHACNNAIAALGLLALHARSGG